MSPVLQIIFGITALLSVYSVFKSLVFNMHMFQLNGYRFSTHSRWMLKNAGRYAVETVVFGLSFTGLLKNGKMMLFAASALLCGIAALCVENRARPAKKPLVYTPRVKRMIVTFCVLEAALSAVCVCMLASERKFIAFMLLGFINSLAPAFVILANAVNKPVELGINRYYTNDAKRMLRACSSLQTIGITGSYGKTSVKFYLYTILRAWRDTLVTPESYNTPMGIVKTIRGGLTPVHKIFLCEMGAKWVGDIKELCNIVHPAHGIITSLGDQHLESFGSRENIIKTKYELADAVPAHGRLYVNFDNEIIRNNPPKHEYISYGTTPDCDYYAFDIKQNENGTSFRVRAPGGETGEFETRLLGHHCVVNITGAIAAAHGFGMTFGEMKVPVGRIEAVKHRMQIVKKNGVTIIDDAFNSNPAGCKAALEALAEMDGERILVTPGMIELGEKEDELNGVFGSQAAEAADRIILIGAKQTAAIRKGALGAGFDENRLYTFEQFSEAMQFVYSLKTEKKKIILLENDLPDNY